MQNSKKNKGKGWVIGIIIIGILFYIIFSGKSETKEANDYSSESNSYDYEEDGYDWTEHMILITLMTARTNLELVTEKMNVIDM